LTAELLEESPACAKRRDAKGNTPLHVVPDAPELAEPLIDLLLTAGVDPAVENDAGQTALALLISNGRDEAADILEFALEGRAGGSE
jgi:ankyrin repeat protein